MAKSRVYPRPRGGACLRFPPPKTTWGLSPPTRGSPPRALSGPPPTGSIPAHAGEPWDSPLVLDIYKVYPRPRGGARRHTVLVHRVEGLSPPTRGAIRATRRNAAMSVLSPPTRGSLPMVLPLVPPFGSIPAHAGEPCYAHQCSAHTGVYPRPRGGALDSSSHVPNDPGLSPPTRGSNQVRTVGVYPRPRGGAEGEGHVGSPGVGLSPPTRGSPGWTRLRTALIGSIPAHAGEPKEAEKDLQDIKVYPRPRGGAALR